MISKNSLSIGDVVQDKVKQKYHVVTDVITTEGNTRVYNYEIYQIYPVLKYDVSDVLLGSEVSVVAKNGTRDSELIMSYVKQKRESLGMYENPKYLKIINGEEIEKEHKKPKAKMLNMPKLEPSEAKYNTIGKIDECLDAMNHLQELHNAFGDEYYLEKRKEVKERLKVLQERKIYGR